MYSWFNLKAFLIAFVLGSASYAFGQSYGLEKRLFKEAILTDSIPINLSETGIFSDILFKTDRKRGGRSLTRFLRSRKSSRMLATHS